MATETTVTFIDDLDGTKAAGTFTFGLNGKTYEIDLSDENADKLHDALAPFIEHGREVKADKGKHGGKDKRSAGSGRTPRGETAAIRKWARENGHELKDRGRIPQPIVEAYHAAA
jgi:hypothetical protein